MDELQWFHITTHTYGAWLYGDPRGFRTRHHREHVEGDYMYPPARGTYDQEFAPSQALLKQNRVVLTPDWRIVVGRALRDRLIELEAEVIAVSMSAMHAHVQAKLPPKVPRKWMGFAKAHAWFVARDHGWVGQLWAKRSRATPINDRRHQENTFHYIVGHKQEGAWVWTFRDPVEAK